jgi:hypothetical protein
MRKVFLLISVSFLVLFATPVFSASISGAVTGYIIEDITITLSDNSTDTTQTDSSGDYSFVGLDNGTYTVTPSRVDSTFLPTSTEVVIKESDNATGTDFAITVAAVDVPLVKPCEPVNGSNTLYECLYEIPTVPAGVTQEFRLETEQLYGNITEFIISCNSTDFDGWYSKQAEQAAGSNDTFIYFFGKDTSHTSNWCLPRNFVNRDNEKSIYFTAKNDDTIPTGIIDNSVTFGN